MPVNEKQTSKGSLRYDPWASWYRVDDWFWREEDTVYRAKPLFVTENVTVLFLGVIDFSFDLIRGNYSKKPNPSRLGRKSALNHSVMRPQRSGFSDNASAVVDSFFGYMKTLFTSWSSTDMKTQTSAMNRQPTDRTSTKERDSLQQLRAMWAKEIDAYYQQCKRNFTQGKSEPDLCVSIDNVWSFLDPDEETLVEWGTKRLEKLQDVFMAWQPLLRALPAPEKFKSMTSKDRVNLETSLVTTSQKLFETFKGDDKDDCSAQLNQYCLDEWQRKWTELEQYRLKSTFSEVQPILLKKRKALDDVLARISSVNLNARYTSISEALGALEGISDEIGDLFSKYFLALHPKTYGEQAFEGKDAPFEFMKDWFNTANQLADTSIGQLKQRKQWLIELNTYALTCKAQFEQGAQPPAYHEFLQRSELRLNAQASEWEIDQFKLIQSLFSSWQPLQPSLSLDSLRAMTTEEKAEFNASLAEKSTALFKQFNEAIGEQDRKSALNIGPNPSLHWNQYCVDQLKQSPLEQTWLKAEFDEAMRIMAEKKNALNTVVDRIHGWNGQTRYYSADEALTALKRVSEHMTRTHRALTFKLHPDVYGSVEFERKCEPFDALQTWFNECQAVIADLMPQLEKRKAIVIEKKLDLAKDRLDLAEDRLDLAELNLRIVKVNKILSDPKNLELFKLKFEKILSANERVDLDELELFLNKNSSVVMPNLENEELDSYRSKLNQLTLEMAKQQSIIAEQKLIIAELEQRFPDKKLSGAMPKLEHETLDSHRSEVNAQTLKVSELQKMWPNKAVSKDSDNKTHIDSAPHMLCLTYK